MKKITICCSANFFEKIKQIEKELKALGFDVITPLEIGEATDYSGLTPQKQKELKNKFITEYLQKIRGSDAILVANYDKNNTAGHIGANVFLEMGFAYALGKKIFLLKPIPEQNNKIEIMGLNPVVINEKIGSIKNYFNK